MRIIVLNQLIYLNLIFMCDILDVVIKNINIFYIYHTYNINQIGKGSSSGWVNNTVSIPNCNNSELSKLNFTHIYKTFIYISLIF